MAAYAAVTSLKNLIHQIQNHPSPPISIEKQQLKSLTENATFLQEFLETYQSPVVDGDEADPLEMLIADAAYAAEDVIESHIVDAIKLGRSTTTSHQKIDLVAEPSTSTGLKPQSKSKISFDYLKPINTGKKVNLMYTLSQGLRKVIKDMDVIKNKVMEKTTDKAQLQRNVSTPADGEETIPSFCSLLRFNSMILMISMICFYYFGFGMVGAVSFAVTSMMSFYIYGFLMKKNQGVLPKVKKDMNLIKIEIEKEKTTAEGQLQRNHVSASAAYPRSSVVVGFEDVSLEIMHKLTGGQNCRQVIPIVGMGGIGKTTLARNVFAHSCIKNHFDVCVWATISQTYNTKEILCDFLSQANKKSKEQLSNMSEQELESQLYKHLFRRRFLIVMDDMWSIDAWDKMQRFFPNNDNGSRIVVTTRLSTLGSQFDNSYCLEMKFLDDVSSWKLFLKTVFGEERCPSELEEIGKKIVETCKGLPLSIVVMGGLLKNLEHTQECWESARKNSSSPVKSENEDFCLKILKLSYNHLPVYLKPCFLYMGVFEEDRAIRVSTVVKLWVSEGFLKPISGKSLEMVAREFLYDLVDRNLILVHELGCTGNIKYCKIHDLLRDLCWREAEKEGFYNVIGQHKFKGLNSQRRVVIHGSTSKEEVDDTLQSMPLARSFVCDSKEVVPLPGSRMLRVLKTYDRDTSGSHDYLFNDLFKFMNLRYLAASVSLVWNLHTLIIFHSSRVSAPDEIWKMPQLRHVEFHKGVLRLPNPPSGNTVIMENLQTLKGVETLSSWRSETLPGGIPSNLNCDDASKIIPNIKKLGVVHGIPSNLRCLSKLESFRCWDIFDIFFVLLSKLSLGSNWVCNFPYSLKKLSLGSNSYHWKLNNEMLEKIGDLPHLQKLKLERAEFHGCKLKEWVTSEGRFPSLKYLGLKWCILKSWMTESSHFPHLEQLHVCGLRELEEIPSEIGEIGPLQSILLEYCSEAVVESAKKITEEQEELQVRVMLFNTEKNQSLRSLASPNFLVEIVDF